jgi:DNA repair exonuclease SbcCD nuclease subunit
MAVKTKIGTRASALSDAAVTDAAIGFRPHSGWSSLIAIAGPVAAPHVIERRRIELADRAIRGTVQPYHFAEEMELKKAERWIAQCLNASEGLAREAIAVTIDKLREQGYRVRACGLVRSSARPLPEIEKVLASHALIHTAEGEMFRDAITRASAHHGLSVLGVKERELFERCASDLGMPTPEIESRLAELGKMLGPPWRQDEKFATLVAWLALAADAGRGPRKS